MLFKKKELEKALSEISALRQNLNKITIDRDNLREEVKRLKEKIKTLENPLVRQNPAQTKQEPVLAKQEHKPDAFVSNQILFSERVFNGIKLTKEQSDTFELMERTNKNYFITGKAGTGKSTVLNYFRANTKKKNIAVVAPTGAAALNVDGQTIHSFFRMDLDPQDTFNKSKVNTSDNIIKTLSSVNVLIIDEVSMVRSDIMDMMDARLRLAKKNNIPFGGCQVIAFGDLYQLPPIASDRVSRDFIISRYGSLFFFGAPGVKQTFNTIELKNVLRQKDDVFIQILNKVRDGSINENDIERLNLRCTKNIPKDCLRIVLTREAAKNINIEKLRELPMKEHLFTAELGGDNPPGKEDLPFEYELRLKLGAKVMMTSNDITKRYVNGSVGEIIRVGPNIIEVKINGKPVQVEKMVATKKVYTIKDGELISEVVGWARQYPMRLAYAVTVHKSQGQTYDQIVLDYSDRNAFASGQTYVALSRCRTLNGIYLVRPIKIQDIYANKEVLRYMETTSPRKENSETKTPAKSTTSYIDVNELPF